MAPAGRAIVIPIATGNALAKPRLNAGKSFRFRGSICGKNCGLFPAISCGYLFFFACQPG
jgi:hypothetical protein